RPPPRPPPDRADRREHSVPGLRAAAARHPRPRARRMDPRRRHLPPLELTMTDDPITAALQQLADHHDQLTQLTDLVTAIGDTVSPSRIPGPHPARPSRPADHRNHPLRPHPAPDAQDIMTDATLRQALAYARRGWPVFPCLPGQKIPATTHGYKNATTDEQQ